MCSVVPVCDEVITACGLVMSGAVGDATPAEVEEASAAHELSPELVEVMA